MSELKRQKKIEAAVELGFLSKSQIESLERERRESNYPVLELAIRNGWLNRKHLEILKIFADPESIVPGYRIDGLLGQGSVGTVYKATQIRMDRPVAIKTIHRSAARNDLTLQRFQREARIVGQLRHPNIIPAFDFGIHNEKLYLVMEFVDGVDAEKQLTKHNRFPESHAWFIARQVCHALDNANQLGIIHRDIKPGNMILTAAPAGTPMPVGVPFAKVADFGLAKFSDHQKDAAITIEQSVSGTPFYMSPEQIQALEIDHRSDIYSLGATIWHFISGSPPVSGTGPLDVISNKMKLEDTWMESTAGMSQSGFQLLAKMCRHDREQRIDDYSELSREIDSVIESLGHSESLDDSEPHTLAEPSPSATFTTIREMAKTYTQDASADEGDDDFLLTDSAGLISKAGAAGKPNSRSRSPVLWGAVLLGGLILPAAIYFFPKLTGSTTGSNDKVSLDPTPAVVAVETPRTRLTKFSGFPMPLFNGTEVDPTQRSSGSWEPAKGGEGEPVLSGQGGFRNFRCRDAAGKPMQLYRFVCGFRHHESNLIEFRLKNGGSSDENAEPLFSVVIKPEKATLTSGNTTNQCELQQFNDEQNFGYHQFRIESQPGHWRIEVNRELLGEIDKPSGFVGDSLVQLSIEGKGSAHFEGISFREFSGEPDGH